MHKSHLEKVVVLSMVLTLVVVLVGCGGSGTKKVTLNSKGGLGGNSQNRNDNQRPGFEQPSRDASEEASPAQPEQLAADFSGGMANGLYPQIGSSVTASFGGGLFPVMDGSAAVADTSANSGNTSTGRGNDMVLDAPGSDSGAVSADQTGTETSAPTSVKSDASSGLAKSALFDRAVDCFARHKETDAMNFLYAHMLTNDENWESYPMNWYKGLKEPRIAFRWGVGVSFTAQKGMTGRHSVIGDPGGDDGASAGGRSSSRSGGRGLGAVGGGAPGGTSTRTGARTYRNMDTSRPDGFLLYYTGDFGTQLVDRLDQRRKHDDAYFGKILKDVPLVASSGSESSDDDSDSDSGNSFFLNEPPIGGAARGGGAGRTPPRGGGAPSGGAQRSVDSSIVDRAKGSGNSTEPDEELVGTIIPGVMLVGQGSKDELIQRARSQGLDVLIIFNVNVRQSKSGERTNMTSLRMIDLGSDSDDYVYRGKQLKDTDVEEALEDDRDLVEKELDRALQEFADSEYKASEMPSGLSESVVENRVEKVLKRDNSNPLPAAVEIVWFYRNDLLSTEFTEKALNRLFDSDDGNNLLSTNPVERLAVIVQWLPADSNGDEDSDDEDL